MTFPCISNERAFRVWSIYTTNAFMNGVCLNMSRFNHSCRSNADHFWIDDTNTRDVRAARKIKKGDYAELYPRVKHENRKASKTDRKFQL